MYTFSGRTHADPAVADDDDAPAAAPAAAPTSAHKGGAGSGGGGGGGGGGVVGSNNSEAIRFSQLPEPLLRGGSVGRLRREPQVSPPPSYATTNNHNNNNNNNSYYYYDDHYHSPPYYSSSSCCSTCPLASASSTTATAAAAAGGYCYSCSRYMTSPHAPMSSAAAAAAAAGGTVVVPLQQHRCSVLSSLQSSSLLFPVREMSKPENNAAALNWRRLHLSRAKLKASARTSALLSGFAMVAMVEINLSDGIPEPLLIAFCVCTTLLVSVHMLALMISTCILPNLEAVASVHGIVAVNESPHEKMHIYIEAAWGFSTVFGILLFMAEIAIICWVVFIKVSMKAALAGTIILIPVAMLFMAFALHFYRNLVAHKFERSAQTVQELEDIVSQLQSGQQQQQEQHHHRLSTGGSQVLHV